MNIPPHSSVFIAMLNMGLGHATRTLPIIRYFQENDWNVFLGSSGRSLTFLTEEFPALPVIELPDYDLHYSAKGVQISRLLTRLPALMKRISEENKITGRLVNAQNIRMIISDQRYGCYWGNIPSFFITHQVRFIAPRPLRPFEFLGAWFNGLYHRKYSGIIIPDRWQNGEGLLSGRLSHPASGINYLYCGILSSISPQQVDEDIDFFFSVSGPEPQRTVFERKLRLQIDLLPGKKVMALGKPESREIEKPHPDVTIYHHLSRPMMQKMMNRSRFLITRPGYSTVMELAELQKRALFIPTPGQTEQQYLAERLAEFGWFHWIPQVRLQLLKDISEAGNYSGFPHRLKTSDSLKIIDTLVKQTVKGKSG